MIALITVWDYLYQCGRLWLVGWFQSKALLAFLEEETITSVIPCGSDWLLCCLIISIPSSGFSVPVSIDVVRMKSYVNSLFNSMRVQVRVSVNKLNLFPNYSCVLLLPITCLSSLKRVIQKKLQLNRTCNKIKVTCKKLFMSLVNLKHLASLVGN